MTGRLQLHCLNTKLAAEIQPKTHIYSKVIASILKGFKLALMCTNDVIKPARGEKKRLSAVSSRGKYRSCSNVQ